MADQPTQTTPQTESEQRSRPLVRLSNWQIILILLVVIGGRLIYDFSQRIVEGQQKLEEQRALQAEIDALLAEQKALEAARLYYSSPAFIEAWAHDQGKMVREGEIIVIPVYAEPAPPPDLPTLPETTTTGSFSPPWHVWWSLFFDGPPPSDTTLGS